MSAVIAPVKRLPSPVENAIVAKILAASGRKRDREDPTTIFPNDHLCKGVLTRASAPVGTTTDAGNAAEVTQRLVVNFLASLAPLSAAAALIGTGVRLPLGNAVEEKVPARTGVPSTTVSWVGEAAPISVRSYALNNSCVLTRRKFGFISTLSREAVRRASGEDVVRQLIREDASATLDAAYFSTDAGTDTVHAGLLNGVSSIAGYAGGDRLALETDLAALSDAVSAAGSGEVIFVGSPKRVARLRIKSPEIAREVTFLPSLAVADTTIIAVDPLSLVHGAGDDIDLFAAQEGVLHMSDDPDEIVTDGSPGAVADPVRSLWQTDAVAFRLLVDVAFAPRRSGAVAWLESATW